MRPDTLSTLSHIVSTVCDNLCRWPRELHDEDALEEKCEACHVPIDLANLAERLDSQPGTHTHTHRCPDRCGLRGGNCEAPR